MEVKCKECLFCGCRTGKSIKVERGFQVECTNCGARGPSGFSSKGALAESDGNIATAAELLNLSPDA
ncbi:hypothetical protein E6Q11_00510 [Candidatus Dojkabacteria bacterium]|uniref:Uncharacterized protein n=1 Tax=Candidatus Dojkabacteria bacterium TaxID=2099670 RepID=A0A5C7JBA0_9BACT|nr:MAG: hypothetical protein E6Q11_00510 [Candidatus Dojkabacteria bacterium]